MTVAGAIRRKRVPDKFCEKITKRGGVGLHSIPLA